MFMDGRSTYNRVAKMMEDIESQTIHMNDLRKIIMMNIGSAERTINSCLKIMNEMGILKDLGNYKFEIIKHEKM